jgi:hypothetical protein
LRGKSGSQKVHLRRRKVTRQVVIVEKTTEIKTVEVPVTEVVQQAIPSWMLLTIIIIGAILVIALIILIIRTRRAA